MNVFYVLSPKVICIYNLCELYPTILSVRKVYHSLLSLNPSLNFLPPAIVEKLSFIHY